MKRPAPFFVSYARRDKADAARFRDVLQPLLESSSEFAFGEWTDQQILPGKHWRAEIDHALERSLFGLLLVSPQFLASKFITQNELPPLLAKPMVVPVALHRIVFDGTVDLKGIEERQVFQDARGRAFDRCRSAQDRRQFAMELFAKIVALLKDVPPAKIGRREAGRREACRRDPAMGQPQSRWTRALRPGCRQAGTYQAVRGVRRSGRKRRAEIAETSGSRTFRRPTFKHGATRIFFPARTEGRSEARVRESCDLTLQFLSPQFEAAGLGSEATARVVPVLLHPLAREPKDIEIFRHRDKSFDKADARSFALELFLKISAVLAKSTQALEEDLRALAHHDERFVDNPASPVSLRRDIDAEHAVTNRCDALTFLNEWLMDPNAPPYCALLGELGMGKTTTAKEFAEASVGPPPPRGQSAAGGIPRPPIRGRCRHA